MAFIKGVLNLRTGVRLFVAAITIASASAQAAVTSFSDYPTFQSAALGLSTYGFNDFDPGGGNSQPFGSVGVTPTGSGVTFSSDNSFVTARGVFANTVLPTDAVIYMGFSVPPGSDPISSTITAGLPTGATAVGFYFGSVNYFGTPLEIKVTSNSGTVVTTFGSLTPASSVTMPADTNPYIFNFIGFTSSSAITQVVFNTEPASNNDLNIYTFSVGSIAAIPEPSIPALFVLGLALIGTIIRRKSR